MNYRKMGNTGLKLSEISLGAWVTFGDQIDQAIASDLIHQAYDRGVNFFDNADIYANGKADIYFCHRYDDETPLEEVVRAMDDLIRQGKVLYWGTSEWRAAQLARAKGIADELGLYPPMVEQPQPSPFSGE